MDKNVIKEALIKDGYPQSAEINDTVERLSLLQDESKDKLIGWLNFGIRPEFEPINGIDSSILRETLGMKEAAIILAYDMLKHHPETVTLFRKLTTNQVKYKPQ